MLSPGHQTSFWEPPDRAIKVIYGDPAEVQELLGEHTAYIERTHLTSRHMNERLVCKTLPFSKAQEMLKASCTRRNRVYNLTRPVKTLHIDVNNGRRRWQPRSPAMAAGLADHIWAVKELLMTVVAPELDFVQNEWMNKSIADDRKQMLEAQR